MVIGSINTSHINGIKNWVLYSNVNLSVLVSKSHYMQHS